MSFSIGERWLITARLVGAGRAYCADDCCLQRSESERGPLPLLHVTRRRATEEVLLWCQAIYALVVAQRNQSTAKAPAIPEATPTSAVALEYGKDSTLRLDLNQ